MQKDFFMKKQIKFGAGISALILMTLFSSCLKKDLPNYPLWDGNYITNTYVEYRWDDSTNMHDGQPVVAFQRLNVTMQIDSVNSVINLSLSIPPISGTFTNVQRYDINQNHLWLSFDVSNSATIAPVGTTPKPGYVTDLTQPQTYEVTAANGQKRTWTIKTATLPALPFINKYEGAYTSNGYLYHPSSPRDITNLVKNVLTASGPDSANSVIVDLGDLGSSGYAALITIDPNTNQLTIVAAPGAGGAPYTMFTSGLPTTDPGYTAQWPGSASCNNTYDPATKTFYVRYGYMGASGWRVTEEVIKRN